MRVLRPLYPFQLPMEGGKRYRIKVAQRSLLYVSWSFSVSVVLGLGSWACAGTDDGVADLGAGGSDVGASGGQSSSGGAAAGTGGNGTGGTTTDVCAEPDPSCELPSGLSHACKQRFALGVNYAWHDFAADFGGLAAWSLPGVAANSPAYASELAEMRSNGVSVVRWWMYPDFRGDGVMFDENGDPSGLGATTALDIQKALELAEQNDVYLVLTLFSFDNFRPDHDVDPGAATLLVRGMAPLMSDAARRAKLIDNIVRPSAQAVAASPHAKRLLGWDVINEPEWAISASTPGAPSGREFTPNAELTAVSLSDMKALITESVVALKAELPEALTSVGWAAAKWAWAFADVDVDFHQPHIYAWVNAYWPYTQTPSELGYDGKPTVMGEYYLASMPFADATSFATINSTWFENGFAGAWSWQYNENKADLPLIKAFADGMGCQTTY